MYLRQCLTNTRRAGHALEVVPQQATQLFTADGLSLLRYLQTGMFSGNHHALFQAGLRRKSSRFQIQTYASQEPGVPHGGPPHHDGVASRLLDHSASVLRGLNITVSNKGNTVPCCDKRLFDPGNDRPVRGTRKSLGGEARMDRDRLDAEIGSCPGKSDSGHIPRVPAGAYLDGNGNLWNGVHHRLHHGLCLTQIFQERCSRAGLGYLGYPAPHVDVHAITAVFHHYPGGLCHRRRIATEELAKGRPLLVGPVKHAEGLLIAVVDGVRGDQFSHDQANAPMSLAEHAERVRRNARHRSKNNIRPDIKIADSHNASLYREENRHEMTNPDSMGETDEQASNLELSIAGAMASQYAADSRAFLGLLADLLETALPGETQVQRVGIFGGNRRPVRRIEVTFLVEGGAKADRYAIEDLGRGPLVATRSQIVRDIALKTESVLMADWIQAVGTAVAQRAEENKAVRDALSGLLG